MSKLKIGIITALIALAAFVALYFFCILPRPSIKDAIWFIPLSGCVIAYFTGLGFIIAHFACKRKK